ncbi:hypothetical protein MJ585_17185 [Klebsiella pneumoniae]|nr:hypothetical protein MJ585_17185 [Klebsiella pneumoniae]
MMMGGIRKIIADAAFCLPAPADWVLLKDKADNISQHIDLRIETNAGKWAVAR